ncbi:MAG TPA: Lrp/AsnC family transcriptional regulator [Ilumatobacteraceae bacterium]|nr:Lrp/AsnC family transcriptional regulator [Ilumatobacteraceae bacterium]
MGGQSETITRATTRAGSVGEPLVSGGADAPPRRGRRGVIDSFDLGIIEHLGADGRMSTKHLAELVGLTDATVAARLRSLMARDIVRVRAVVDWEVAGLRSPMVFFVRVRGRSVAGIAERLLNDPQVCSVCNVFGSADLVVRVLLADPIDAMTFAEEVLGAIDGLQIVMSLLDVDVAKHANGWHTGAKVPDQLPSFPTAGELLDAVDARLLECLVQDARQSLRQIGRFLDVSEHTVRARLRRLEDVGLVRICAQVDHEVVDGGGESAYLALRTHNAHVQPIIDLMVGQPEFRTVDRVVGEYNVLGFVAAGSRAELADAIDRMRSAPGVERGESWLVANQQLGAFPWARF